MLVLDLRGRTVEGWEDAVKLAKGPFLLVGSWLLQEVPGSGGRTLESFCKSAEPPNVSQISLRSLGDGLPTLLRTVSRSLPSVPSERQHESVMIEMKKFGLLTDEAWRSIRNAKWQLRTRSNAFVYCSENDIATAVASLIVTMMEVLGLNTEILAQAGTFAVRPDLWVLTMLGVPVGVVEVKKPDVGQTSVLDEPTVLGELYDYMLQLPNFYGVKPVFGIVTTMEKWRICWLPSEKANLEAALSESLPSKSKSFSTPVKVGRSDGDGDGSPPGLTPSKRNPKIHLVQEDGASKGDKGEFDVKWESTEASPKAPRIMHATRVYRWDDENCEALRAVGSVLCKMSRATSTPFSDPFDRLDERRVLCFEKGPFGLVFWDHLKHLKGKGNWNEYADPPKNLFAIEDLGRGADGRVWLMCSHSGAVCVLKFSNNGLYDVLMHEEKMWHQVYPQFRTKVAFEKWCSRDALKMPHFSAVAIGDRPAMLELVEQTLRVDFDRKGFVHGDVAWRNVGLYKKGDTTKAILFDMASVRSKDSRDDRWIEEAMLKLRGVIE